MVQPRINRYLPPGFDPVAPYWTLDYNKTLDDGRLEKRHTFGNEPHQRGALIRLGYYQLPEPTVRGPFGKPADWGELVVEEVFEYVYDSVGFASERNQKIYWLNEDDTLGHAKTQRPKLYFGKSRTDEGVRRRGNVRDLIEEWTIQMLIIMGGGDSTAVENALLDARAFVNQDSIRQPLDAYMRYSDASILEAVATNPDPLLSQDISVVPGLPSILSGPTPWEARAYFVNWFNTWGYDATKLNDLGMPTAAGLYEAYAGPPDNLDPPA